MIKYITIPIIWTIGIPFRLLSWVILDEIKEKRDKDIIENRKV